MADIGIEFEDYRVPISLVPNSSDNSIRILGNLFNEYLTFEHHAFALKSKLKGIYSLNATRNIFDKQLKMIFYAFFHSHINYCSNLFNALTNNLKDQIFISQKKQLE